MLFLLDFVIFLLVLVSIILTPLASLPFFPKILSDQTLLSQFIFIFGIFLAFLLYCVRSLLKSYDLSLKSRVVTSFALFSIIVLFETIYTLHPGFSLTTKQFSLANIDSLLPGLAWLALLFLLIIFISNPYIQKFKKILFPFILLLSISYTTYYIVYTFTSTIPHLSLLQSWQIALGQIGQSPLVGTGPGLFLQAFNKFKTSQFNLSPFWQAKFTSSANEYLEILTTTGLLGFGAYLLFLVTVLRSSFWLVQNRLRNDSGVATLPRMTDLSYILLLISYVLLSFFIPLTLPLRIIFILLLTLALDSGWWASNLTSFRGVGTFSSHERASDAAENFWQGDDQQDPRRRLTGPFARLTMFIFCGLILFLLIPYFRAEISFQQAQYALTQNKPQDAYQKNLAAIQFFPYKDNYHFILSQISLAWANALAQNKNLSTEQKTLVGQLLGQAVSQAKLAITLAPQKASNLENLGIIYKNLIGVAANSDRWSLGSLNSASQLDPVNPILRLEIGGVYYIEKDYENAQKAFQNSLYLKPDYANGLYNLALTQHALGNNTQAINSLKKVINLTTPGSIDFQNAQKQLSLWNQEESSTN